MLTRFSLVLAICVPAWPQIITSVAGNNTWGQPYSVTLDAAGNLYVPDYSKHVVYKIDQMATTTIVAGKGTAGYAGDGGPATGSALYGPFEVAVDSAGNLYIADQINDRIRKVSANGVITTLAGTGRGGFSGDGGPSTSAQINGPAGMLADSVGNLYFVDSGNARIRKISAAGVITTVGGTGGRGFSGDGGPATVATMDPVRLALGPDESLYFSDGNNLRVRKIAPNGTVSTVAGSGTKGYSGDGGPALAAAFISVNGVAVDSSGNLYIGEHPGERIRKVAVNGIITTYAGTGRAAFSGDGGPATDATLDGPAGVAVDSDGSLYIADTVNDRIRKVAIQGGPTITGVGSAFMGKAGFSSNSYLEIYGTNLSSTTRLWGSADFNGSNAPTTVDGVSVTVNGKPAFVYYVNPSQINVNTPEDNATGPVMIQVRNSLGISNAFTATRARVSPTLQTVPQFNVGGRQYVVAQTSDFRSFIGRQGLVAGLSFTPAHPGDTIQIYALGLGPTNPATHAGVVAPENSALALPFEVRIGGVPAQVTFAGMVANTIGLYQLNVVVPQVPAGDQTIELSVDGVSSSQTLMIGIGS